MILKLKLLKQVWLKMGLLYKFSTDNRIIKLQ